MLCTQSSLRIKLLGVNEYYSTVMGNIGGKDKSPAGVKETKIITTMAKLQDAYSGRGDSRRRETHKYNYNATWQFLFNKQT